MPTKLTRRHPLCTSYAHLRLQKQVLETILNAISLIWTRLRPKGCNRYALLKALNIVDTKLTMYRNISADHRHRHPSGKDDLRGQSILLVPPISMISFSHRTRRGSLLRAIAIFVRGSRHSKVTCRDRAREVQMRTSGQRSY